MSEGDVEDESQHYQPQHEKSCPEINSSSSDEANIESDSDEAKRYLPPGATASDEPKVTKIEKLQRKNRALDRAKFFNKLHKENMQKIRPRSGSPISRKEYLEKLEWEECKFKPELGEATLILAKESKSKRRIQKIDELLYEDAIRRKERKKMLEQNVRVHIHVNKTL